MNVPRKIKNALGLVYICIFSFALALSFVSPSSSAFHSRAAGQTNGTWSVDSSYELVYSTQDFIFDHVEQIELLQESEHDFSLTVDIYGYQGATAQIVEKCDNQVLVFSNANYTEGVGTNNSVGTLYGECIDIDNGNPTTINIYVAPTANNVSDDGWIYDEDDSYLYYYDSQNDASYDLESITYSVLDNKATLAFVYNVPTGGDDLYQYAEIFVYDIDYDENAISGLMYLNGEDTDVTVKFSEEITVNEVDKWVSLQNSLYWIASSGSSYQIDTLTVASATFYSHPNPADDYLQAEYLYDGTTLPAIVLTEAGWENTVLSDEPAYLVSGASSFADDEKISLFFEESALIFIIENGWRYDRETMGFSYIHDEEDITGTYVSGIFYEFGDDCNNICLTYEVTVDGELLTETFKITDIYNYSEPEEEGQKYSFNGFYNNDQVAFELDSLEVEFQARWAYDDGKFKYWAGPDDLCEGTIEKVIYNNYAYESEDNECYITISAYSNSIQGEKLRTDTLVIYSAQITIDPRVSQDGGRVEGKFLEFGHPYEIPVGIDISSIDIENELVEEKYNYMDGFNELVYMNGNGEHFLVDLVSAVYNDTNPNNVTCTISFEFDESESSTVSGVFILTNAKLEEEHLETDYSKSTVSGYWENETGNTHLFLDVRNLSYYQEESETPYWVYNDDMLELYYIVPGEVEYGTELVQASYYDRTDSVTLLYSIVLYTFIEEESDAPSYETTIVDQKTVHIENVPLELESDEEFVYVQGNCLELDLEEPITLKVEKDKFVQVNYDEDPGTITPDQQLDILDYLPEEKVVEEDRIDDSIAAISAETAHQIIEVFKNTTNEVEAKKQAGTITQEQYEKQINIVERVIEASVVVGAAQTNAKDEGKKINDALPANSGLGDIGTMLDLFYKTQLDYLLGNRDVPEKGETRKVTREPLSQQTRKIDATCEEFTTMIEYVDTAVSHMKGAALYIRNCSKTETKTVVKSYISRVRVSSFRNFDEEKANNEFVEAVKKAIMLNMQQQVIEALEKDHKPSNNVDKELLYQEQLEAVKDYETFEEIVLEVLRQKYVSLTNQEIEIDTFRGVYDNIFRSWALDDPSLNTSGITLEELTAATIQTTRARANNFTYRETIGKEESIFFIVLGSALVVGLAGAISVPLILRKKRRGLGE